jgi:ParG/GIY-YIG catalytic domain
MKTNIDPLTLPSLPLGERSRLPKCSAIYFVMRGEHVLYIGKTINLAQRWVAHHRWGQVAKLDAIKIAWLECNDKNLLTHVETALIQQFNPELNKLTPKSSSQQHILIDWTKLRERMRNAPSELLATYKMFLPESLRAKFKSICALKGTSMNEVLVQLVQKWIEENENISSSKKDKKG